MKKMTFDEIRDLLKSHDCNDCYYFGKGVGCYEASRNPQDALEDC